MTIKTISSQTPVKNITKCLVLFHPRSGSSWLIKLLEENKNFRVGYEIFGGYKYHSGSPTELEQENLLNDFYNSNLDRSILAWNDKKGAWVTSISLRFTMQLFVRYPPIKLSIKQPLLNSLNKIVLRSFV